MMRAARRISAAVARHVSGLARGAARTAVAAWAGQNAGRTIADTAAIGSSIGPPYIAFTAVYISLYEYFS
eukprot:SAG22_NODE_2830_length_2172_cov_399.013025_2_plen_70_part_00